MADMTVEQEAEDLLRAGASQSEIHEMEASLRFCIRGISIQDGAWQVSPPVARILRDTSPAHALPRLERGIKVCEAARRLCLV